MLQHIVVLLDGSPLAELALPYSTELARVAGARMTLVRASRLHHHLHLGPPDDHPGEALAYLAAQAERLRADGLVVDTAVPRGEIVPAIMSEIERRQPDLVAMGTHGRSGLGRWVYGSITEAVVGQATRPILLVRAWASQHLMDATQLRGKRIFVPLDGSAFAEAALPVAMQLARTLGSDVMLGEALPSLYPLLYSTGPGVVPTFDVEGWMDAAEDDAKSYLSQVAERLSSGESTLHVSTEARTTALPTMIRELASARATDVGLVVMATHARTGLGRAILGSEADAVLRSDQVPLVLVRSTDDESRDLTVNGR